MRGRWIISALAVVLLVGVAALVWALPRLLERALFASAALWHRGEARAAQRVSPMCGSGSGLFDAPSMK